MATVVAERAKRSALGATSRGFGAPRLGRLVSRWALPAFTALAIGYLLIPIAVMILFSFNDYQGKFNFIWHGFTLYGWLHPLDWPGLPNSLTNSLLFAFVSTVVASVLGI